MDAEITTFIAADGAILTVPKHTWNALKDSLHQGMTRPLSLATMRELIYLRRAFGDPVIS